MNFKDRLSIAYSILTGKAQAPDKDINPSNLVVPAFRNGQPTFKDWSGELGVKEGYKANVWVYRCVSTLASLASSVPWVVYRKQRGENSKPWVPVEGHDLEQLLQRPNPFFSGQDLIELLTQHMNLDGNAYWLINEVRGKPVELWPVLPFQMYPIPDQQDFLYGYKYYNGDREITLPPQAVTHFRFLDPSNLWLGMAPLKAAGKTVDADVEALNWNKSALENRAVTDGVFTYKGSTPLNPTNWKEAIKLIKQEWAGSRNARKPMVLSEFEYQDMAKSPKDMDFIEGRKLNREEICAAFKVPPIVVGILDNASYSNYDQALKALWTITIIPFLEDIRSGINLDITPRFGDDLKADFDTSVIDALNEDTNEKWKRYFEAVDRGLLTINEAREKMGYEPIEGGDVSLIQQNMIPLGTSPQNNQEQDNPNEDDDDKKKDIDQEIKELPYPDELKAFNLQTEEQKTIYWKNFERTRMGYYGLVTKQVQERLEKEKEALIKAIDKVEDIGRFEQTIREVIEEQRKEWRNLFIAFYIEIAETFGNKTMEGFKSIFGPAETKQEEETGAGAAAAEEIVFDVYDDAVQSAIATKVGEKIKTIDQTTLEQLLPQIREQIGEAVEQGEGIRKIAKRIKDTVETKYDEYSTYRATRIARTEVVSSSNLGSYQSAVQTGLDLDKEWIATRDSRVRDPHKIADEQTRELKEDFFVGGEYLPYPGGGSLPANNINCRCSLGYITKDR